MFQLAPADYLPLPPRDHTTPIGLVGAGFVMRDCHVPAYRQMGLNPVAITSRTRAQAEAVASQHGIAHVHNTLSDLLQSGSVEVIDIAVPPHQQRDVAHQICESPGTVRGILAQKPLGVNLAQAVEIVRMCDAANLKLVVNQNMRYDQAVRACKRLLNGGELGEPVLATIDMRAIPHWMPWQREQGWVTLRIMSIHHLDTFRFWFGTPERVFASVRPDPRTAFPHEDGIALAICEYASGLRAMTCDDVWAGPAREGAAADLGIRFRVEGTRGLACGTIGWPNYPEHTPSTLDYSTVEMHGEWQRPQWPEAWFPEAFAGPMCELLRWLQDDEPADLAGRDNLATMALVDACYESVAEHRAVALPMWPPA